MATKENVLCVCILCQNNNNDGNCVSIATVQDTDEEKKH